MPYVQYCCTCYREKQNSLEAARINRTEGNRATSVSERSSLWPQSVPGWRICERLPPGSWAVVGLGVRKMALCCAVACCVEYCCNVVPRNLPAGNSSAIYRKPTKLSQCCRIWAFLLSMSSDFDGGIADNLHHTQSPPQVDHYYYYANIYVCIYKYSFYHVRYPGTMTVYFKVLGSQCHYCSMYY